MKEIHRLMGFRTKLIFLTMLLNLLAGAAVWYMVSSAQTIGNRVRLFVPLTGYLEGISALHSGLTRQSKEVLDYLITRDGRELQEFKNASLELEKSFQRCKQAALAQQTLGFGGEAEDLTLIARTYAQYRDWHEALTEVFALAQQGDWDQALRLYERLQENSLKRQLLPAIDKALNDGMVEAEETYHALLLAVGALPWGTAKNSQQLELINANIEFLLRGNRTNASVNAQFTDLIEYLLQGQEIYLLKYQHSLALSKEALALWARAAAKKEHLETPETADYSQLLEDVNARFQHFSQQAAAALQLKQSGRTREALDLILGHGDQLIANFQASTALAIQHGESLLIASTDTRSTTGYIIFFLFLSLTSFISIRISTGMLRSIKIIRSSMEEIRAGHLAHRILLKPGDVIANLGETFNAMMDSLSQAQSDLEHLRAAQEVQVQERTAQLAAANRDLESFNGMVSHDLRTPLTLMHGYSEILQTQLGDSTPPLVFAALKNVIAACEEMSTTISTLEALARAGSKQLVRKPVALEELVKKVMIKLLSSQPQRKIELVINPAPEAHGDQDLLEIVMTNLLSNAWKYTGKVPTAKIEFGSLEQQGRRIWFVRDNGAGFDMRKADQLFEAFSRLHSQKEFNGTGIGLSTVQRIIHRHGGEIWAEGRVGEGATFYFHLGEDQSPAEQVCPALEESPEQTRTRG